MKYVVTGASTYGVKNMGDDAMLVNMVQGINREDPNAEIIFLARHLSLEYDKLFGFKSIKNLDHDSNKDAEGRIFLGFNKGDSTNNINDIKKYIEEADLLIIGGNSFMEVSENVFLRGVSSYATTLGILAKFCGTPYALYGLNIVDPVRESLTIQHSKFLCENAVSITVREKQVLAYLQDMKINTDNVKVCGDPAFGMESIHDKSKVHDILDKCNINLLKDKKVLSIGYRFEYWKNNEQEFEYLAQKMAYLIDELVNNYNYQVLFIPNCTYSAGNKWEDDRLVNKLIKKKLKTQNDIFFIEKELDVFETFSLFSITDLHISNRRHSNAFAAMHGNPFLSITISHATHISALLESLDCLELNINLDNDLEDTMNKVVLVLSNNKMISEKLSRKTTNLKKKAQKHIPEILEMVEKLKDTKENNRR